MTQKKSPKEIALTILYFIWGRILPMVLPIGFMVGVFFNLWKMQGLNPWLAGGICTAACGVLVYFWGKLLKFW